MNTKDIDEALANIKAMTPEKFREMVAEAEDEFGSTLEPFIESWIKQINSGDEK